MSIERLVQKVRDNDVVLWAGAGYSLYAGMPSAQRLRELILEQCTEEEREYLEHSSLSDVAEKFIDMRNGSRNDLQKIIMDAFDIEPKTIWVHNLLTEIPQITTIITTNYDKLFEESYGRDLFAIVSNQQLPLANKRIALYKIHGDIDNPGSIVITTSDYTNFFRNQDTPIWNKVKSLLAEKTVVFVGYSLGDPNVDFLFENLLQSLGNFHKEPFLVAPNLPNHQLNRLNRKKVHYINMTGEDFTKVLHDEIKKKLLIDILEKRLDPQIGLNLLKKHGMFTNLELSPDGPILKSIGSYDKQRRLSLDITFTGINLFEKLKESPFSDFEISSENIQSIHSHFEGISLPQLDGLVNLKFSPSPLKEAKVDLYFLGTDHYISDVTMEVYAISVQEMLIKFKHPLFLFEMNIKDRKFSFSFHQFNTLTEAKQAFSFLHYLISGEDFLKAFLKEEQKEIQLVKFDKNENIHALLELENVLNIIDKLLDIQKHYRVIFRNFEFKLSNDDIDGINIIWSDLKGVKQELECIHITARLNEPNAFKEYIEEKGIFGFKLETKESIYLELFNEKIPIHKKLCVHISDAYVSNKEQVCKAIENGQMTVDLDIRSKKDGIYKFLSEMEF